MEFFCYEFIFFKLSVSYTSPPFGAKILDGKTFKAENWKLNWAVFSKAIEPEIEKTYLNCHFQYN